MDSPATLVPAKHVDIPKWLKTAQGIRQGGFFTVFSCLGNSLTVIVSCAFFAFGTFVLRHDGVPIVDVPHLGLLKDAARYVGVKIHQTIENVYTTSIGPYRFPNLS
jgi:hypothetical protein